MKRVLFALLVLTLLTTPVFAWGEYNGNVTVPHWFNTSYAEASQICTDHGKTYTGDYIGVSMYWADWTHESHIGGMADYDSLLGAPQLTPNTSWVNHYVTCSGPTVYGLKYYNYALSPLQVMANFNATPTSGPASLYVIFTDMSTNTTTSSTYNWSISPATGWLSSNVTSKDMTASFTAPGNYTITHGANSGFSSDIETKTDYITVYNATTDYITTGFAAMDEPRWVQLAGSSIRLHDVENNTWKNVTSSATGYEEITTLANHTINAYASMTGYGDEDLLARPAWNGGTYTILMYPTGYGNVSAGNVTLYVNVWAESARLEGATVNMAYQDGTSQFNDYAVTGSNGMVTFTVPNNTLIYLYGEKSGYVRSGTTINSGTGSGGTSSVTADITLTRQTVTTSPTVTTLPGGGTPAPTADPYPCDADHPENCQRKETEMGNILVYWGPTLINFFILLTIIGGLKLMGK